MNFQLQNANSSKKKQKLFSYGLNQRGDTQTVNVLKDGEDDEDDDDHNDDDSEQPAASNQQSSSSRSRVNAEIAREQAALRKRAQQQTLAAVTAAAAATAKDDAATTTNNAGVYDYDGVYDSFQPAQQQQKQQEAANKKNGDADNDKKSRYIGDLLKAAEERQRERELRIERKVAKEQAAEEVEGDLSDKGRFITAAYKRKLQERSLWQQDQEEKEKREREADVTKEGNAQVAMANFYSNFNKNVAFGGASGVDDDGPRDNSKEEETDESLAQGRLDRDGNEKTKRDFLEGFDRAADDKENNESDKKRSVESPLANISIETTQQRHLRQQKIEQARIRYLERHPERRKESAGA